MIISSTVHSLSSSFSKKAVTKLVLLDWIGKGCRKWNQANRWREVITNISLLKKLPAVNGLIDDQSQFCWVTFLICNQRQLKGSQKLQSLVQMLSKCIIKVWEVSSWSTKEQHLIILIVSKSAIRFYFYFFRFDVCSLWQCLHPLQYDASKRPYPVWLQNHCLNPCDWSVQKLQQRTTRTKSWIKEATSVSAIASPSISAQPKMLWLLPQRRIWQKNIRGMHLACSMFFCLVKERNCFVKHYHS